MPLNACHLLTTILRSCHQIVYKLTSLLDSPDFIEQHRKRPQDFTRRPVLTFKNICLLLLNQLKAALQVELDNFIDVLSEATTEALPALTAQAFSKARNKVKPSAFVALNQSLQQWLNDAGLTSKTWHGFRLLSVDGSMCHLPLEDCQIRYFGAREDNTQPVARLSTLYDVLNHQILDAALGTEDICERGYAQGHLPHAPAHSLILFDRGYPAHWLFVDLQQHGHQVVMRLPATFNTAASLFREAAADEQLITLTATSAHARTLCEQSGVDPAAVVQLRLIKVILDSGEIEVLATSLLDGERYPATLFKALYHLRWGVETDYRQLKQTHELQNFSGRTPQAVKQDFYSQVLLNNLASLFCASAQVAVDQRHAGSKHPWKVNYTQALSRLKNTLVVLLINPLQESLCTLLRKLARSTVAIHPGRSFPRKRRRPGTRGCEGYKRTM